MSQTTGRGQPGRLPLRRPADTAPYRAYRAPLADGAVVAIPSLNEAARLLAGAAREAPCILAGRQLQELREAGRQAVVDLARTYVSSYRDVPPLATGPLLMAGHQPELFHPGVWLKNFALGKLARTVGGTALNLVVDTDVVKQTSIRVPGGSPTAPHVERIAYDTAAPAVAYEERPIVDRPLFESFDSRVAEAIAPLVPNPCVRAFWPVVQSAARRTDRLGLCLAQARHLWEQQWGLHTLELPLSHTCRLPEFAWFVLHLLIEHEAFRRIYNEAVLDYRRAHRIRSQNHPVPLLAQEDQWVETPFWTWTTENPQRRRLFVCRIRGGVRLADLQGWELHLPLSPGGLPERAVEHFALAAKQGIRIRTRALSTTLFTRLLLADLFVHGIGGAKYDQITDRILASFFGVTDAPVLVVSATLRLPVHRSGATPQQLRQVAGLLRELRYHGERFLDGKWPLAWVPDQLATPCSNPACGAELNKLAERKRELLAQLPTTGSRRAWCHAIRQVNKAMFALLAPLVRQAEAERERLVHALAADQILGSREYAFCLYPEPFLRDFLLEFLYSNP